MATAIRNTTGICLRELFPEAQSFGDRPVHATSCCADSRHVRPGDLFVALDGGGHDGHDFAADAVARGASAVLAERPLPLFDVPTLVVRDTRDAYGRLCQALAGYPSDHLKVIGVTGTNGKTTTASLIAAVLAHAAARPGLMGTLGYTDGDVTTQAADTTPTAPVLAQWLGRMVASECSHAVVEVSSRALAESRLAGIHLDAVCVTNIRDDHLDRHGSIRNYRRAKARILDHLATGVTVLNADDPVSVGWLSRIDGPALTVGIHAEAELMATVVERYRNEQTFLLTAGSETVPVRTRAVGDHHVANCLIAAAVGLSYGIDLPTAVRGLESVDTIPGRMETIDRGQPFGTVLDSARNPYALAATLGALREVTEGRLICVFGPGEPGDRTKRQAIGSVVDRLSDVSVMTGDDARFEPSRQSVRQVEQGIEGRSRVETIPDRSKAIRWALSHAETGDTVVIAGYRHPTALAGGKAGLVPDDRLVVCHALDRLAAQWNAMILSPFSSLSAAA